MDDLHKEAKLEEAGALPSKSLFEAGEVESEEKYVTWGNGELPASLSVYLDNETEERHFAACFPSAPDYSTALSGDKYDA